MRIIFMGTPEFAVPILKSLVDAHDVAAAVTQPDRPKGRGHSTLPPPVKELALTLGIPVLQPAKIAEIEQQLNALQSDVFVVVAYGQILPAQILTIPPKGCINIHASLLPKYRGAAPIHRAILNGEQETGITIMYMDEGMDTGDMILKKSLPIAPSDRYKNLHDKMAALSCECILEALALLEKNVAPRTPQDHTQATYALMLKKEEGIIDWNNPGAKILCQIRALDPWPGSAAFYNGQAIKIWDAQLHAGQSEALPGTVLASGKELLVKTADSALAITEVQAQNSKRMKAEEFLRGKPIPVGEILGKGE